MEVPERSDKFLWVGNSPAIDFVNTQIVQQGTRVDLLEEPGDLLEWLRDSEMLGEQSLRKVTRSFGRSRLEEALCCAKDYRKALRTALQKLSRHGTVDRNALEETNRLLEEPRSIFALSDTKRGAQLQQQWIVGQPEDLSRPIAFAFARLLTDQDSGRIRKCHSPECILFFLDTSKSGTRTWCSMNICGNKMRISAFRKRQKSSGAGGGGGQ